MFAHFTSFVLLMLIKTLHTYTDTQSADVAHHMLFASGTLHNKSSKHFHSHRTPSKIFDVRIYNYGNIKRVVTADVPNEVQYVNRKITRK